MALFMIGRSSRADNHNAYPDRFKRFIELAKQNGGEFGLDAANALYGQNAQESINNNDKLFFNSYTVRAATKGLTDGLVTHKVLMHRSSWCSVNTRSSRMSVF